MIPQSFIDDLLNRIDIVDLVGTYVDLKGSGSSRKACCPFHNEKTPSFSVSQDKQLFHCFGCGAGGNSVTFIMQMESIDFPGAIEIIAGSVGVEIPKQTSTDKKSYSVDLYDITARFSDLFRLELRNNIHRNVILQKLDSLYLSRETSNILRVGYSSGNRAKAFSALGLDERAKRYLSGFKLPCDTEAIVIPVYGFKGSPIGFICEPLSESSANSIFPTTAIFDTDRDLFNLYSKSNKPVRNQPLYLVEHHQQVLALGKLGHSNVCSTLTGNVTHEHARKLIKSTEALKVILPDSDESREHAWVICQNLITQLVDGHLVDFFFYKDKVDLVSFLSGLNHSEPIPLPEFLIGEIQDRHSQSAAASIEEFATPILEAMPESMVKSLIWGVLKRG